MSGEVTNIYLRNIPVNVRDLFKSWCAKRGTNMTKELIKFMRESPVGKDDAVPVTNRGPIKRKGW